MSIEHAAGAAYARCDRCGLRTPAVNAASDYAIEQIIQLAGWRAPHPNTAYCPKCSALSSGVFARALRRTMARETG